MTTLASMKLDLFVTKKQNILESLKKIVEEIWEPIIFQRV